MAVLDRAVDRGARGRGRPRARERGCRGVTPRHHARRRGSRPAICTAPRSAARCARCAPDARLFGMGGERMAAAGSSVLADVTAARGHRRHRARSACCHALPRVPPAARRAARRRAGPHALVVIDFPEFNLRLARVARRAGVPVVYFIPPQVWAWRGGRDPHDPPPAVRSCWRSCPSSPRSTGARASPWSSSAIRSLDALAGAPSREAARARLGLGADAPVIGLLPGSRRGEIERLLPVMRDGGCAHRRRAGRTHVPCSRWRRRWMRALVERLAAGDDRRCASCPTPTRSCAPPTCCWRPRGR